MIHTVLPELPKNVTFQQYHIRTQSLKMNILQWAYHWARYLSWLSVVMAGRVAGVRGRPALWNSKPPSWRHCSHSNSLTILRLYPCEYKLLQMQCHSCKTMRKFLQININIWNCSAINPVGIFCSPGSRSGFHIRIRIHGPDWIRIQSSSETLGVQLISYLNLDCLGIFGSA